jgi:hypothetical protein
MTSRNPDGSIVHAGCVGLINCSAPLLGREHPATWLLDDAVVRDGWPITARIYVCQTGESMKVVELAAAQEGRWRNIPITLRTRARPVRGVVVGVNVRNLCDDFGTVTY